MIKKVGKRLKIEKAIKQAFENNEFELYYQPQVNENSETISVEALLRWEKLNELGINTEILIETIEQIGLIHELGYWVFDQACSQLDQWNQQGGKIQSIAINVSAKQFHQKLFIEQVMKVIKSYQLDPSQIVIELTEAVIIDDMVSLIAKFNELRGYGIRISLDDFGTGYSSLAYLKHLPINQLKIDKLFIHDLSFDLSSQHIVKTIIDLAVLMKIELVAEGIEIEEQFDILKQLGCKCFQ
jgi:EAL domain-containing protein (putative c-di-GMP-specific phosphodiesterase class I)